MLCDGRVGAFVFFSNNKARDISVCIKSDSSRSRFEKVYP